MSAGRKDRWPTRPRFVFEGELTLTPAFPPLPHGLVGQADFASDVHMISLWILIEQQHQSGPLPEPLFGRLTANNLPGTIHELTRKLRLKMRQRPRHAIPSAS